MTAENTITHPNLPDAKRRLLEKMLSGGAARKRQAEGVTKRVASDPVPISLEQQNVWLHSSMAPASRSTTSRSRSIARDLSTSR